MSKTHVATTLRLETEKAFHRRCAYCQSPQLLMNVPYEMDHILPEKKGGETVSDNLAYSCPLCNAYKGIATHGTDPLSKTKVSLFHPRRQRWTRHFRWTEDSARIEGRTRCGRATVEALRLNNEHLVRLRIIWLAIGSSPPDWEIPILLPRS